VRRTVLGDVVQDLQQQRDRLGEVQGPGGVLQDLLGLAQLGIEVVDAALGGAGEQGTGMGQDQRVVIDVDDAAVRGDGLGDVVGVEGGQARTDVQELADPYLAGQVTDGAVQESPAGAGNIDNTRSAGTNLFTDFVVEGGSCPCRPASNSRPGPRSPSWCRAPGVGEG